jgi:hypothetical protein
VAVVAHRKNECNYTYGNAQEPESPGRRFHRFSPKSLSAAGSHEILSGVHGNAHSGGWGLRFHWGCIKSFNNFRGLKKAGQNPLKYQHLKDLTNDRRDPAAPRKTVKNWAKINR